MKIINLNKHAITLRINEDIVFPPSGQIATVDVNPHYEGDILCDGIYDIPLYSSQYGNIKGLPSPQEGVPYLVNMLVGQRGAALGRKDLIGPDSGPSAIRYAEGAQKGKIKAVTQFVKY